MDKVCFAIGVSCLATSCSIGYGPLQDHSEFVSARLTDDRNTVVFSFHDYAYRPASGWRAFPDGGIPHYVTDVNLLGIYDLKTREVRIIRREKNTEWQPGSGLFTIQAAKGTQVLISQGGQLRGPFKLGGRHLLLDLTSAKTVSLDLKSDLARHGRNLGAIDLVDTDGALLFMTLSLDEAKDSGARKNEDIIPEIWVRTASGEYLKVAATAHYQCVRNGEVFYWMPSTREFMAFSIAGRTTRKAPEFKIPELENVDIGVTLSSNRKVLELGVKSDGQWKYKPLELTPDMLK